MYNSASFTNIVSPLRLLSEMRIENGVQLVAGQYVVTR